MHAPGQAAASTLPLSAQISKEGTRVLSIDVFRGLTMCLMIFVNDLASVKGLPWWNYHMPARENFMTYVDMVFPTFLFIVGMSLPIAIDRRFARGASTLSVWRHVIARSVSLLLLGLALANAEKGSPQYMRIGPNLWGALTLLGGVLFWAAYPPSSRYRRLFTALRVAGLLLLVCMFAIFRRVTADGQVRWLDFSYWEILGIIGWTYLAACLVFIPIRRWRWAPLLCFGCFLLMNVAASAGWLPLLNQLPMYIWPFSNGAFTQLVFAGATVSSFFIGTRFDLTLAQKARACAAFAAFCLVSGYALSPLGISKIRATPTWCLYTAAAATVCFLLLYWICDLKREVRWAAPFKPAGSNTLLTYLLPDFYYFTVGTILVFAGTSSGWTGVVRAALFTAIMLGLSALLTRYKVRVQL